MAGLYDAHEALLSRLLEHVGKKLAHVDGSHDVTHVQRVHALALRIAREEGITSHEELFLLRAAALLHDVDDYKYSGSDEHAKASVSTILEAEHVDAALAARIQRIIAAVSFHTELAAGDTATDVLSKIVQDADRLEAIGAIGIARCLMFGGAKLRPLYDAECLSPEWRDSTLARNLSKEEYSSVSGTTVGHFFAKLLRLKNLMKTATGHRIAQQRHDYMLGFLSELFGEIAATL